MPVRPLAAFRLRPVKTDAVRRAVDTDLIKFLAEGEESTAKGQRVAIKADRVIVRAKGRLVGDG